LIDLGSVGITGIEEFRKLKVQKPDVRFVVTSVFFDIDIKEKLIVEGVNAFIQKPYQPENILKVVREVLDSKPA